MSPRRELSARPQSQRQQWHQQIWGVSPGYRQNETLLEAVRAAEQRPSGVTLYAPQGICLDPDGKSFMVRPPTRDGTRDASPSHARPAVAKPQTAPPPGSPGLASYATRQKNLRKWYEKAK